MGMNIARVFPRQTNATPVDSLAFIGEPPLFPLDPIDEVHISVTFSWDLPYAESLAKRWGEIAPVKIGGPATGERGDEFIAGRYLKYGYVITSRGCPNRCWFCSVWKREGVMVRELPIQEGWNVLDDNLLACSESHIRAAFAMLERQPEKAEFTGGLEAKRLQPWHVDLLAKLNPKQMFFAYDTPDDLEPLQQAGKMLLEAGFTVESSKLRCYCLIGYPGDDFEKAEARLFQCVDAGFMPMAMLWRNKSGVVSSGWKRFQRDWVRPSIVGLVARQRREALCLSC